MTINELINGIPKTTEERLFKCQFCERMLPLSEVYRHSDFTDNLEERLIYCEDCYAQEMEFGTSFDEEE